MKQAGTPAPHPQPACARRRAVRKKRLCAEPCRGTWVRAALSGDRDAGDEEMAARIARHRADRGQGWTTLEEPLEIARALAAEARPGRVVVVDCLTLWLSNLMLAGRDPGAAIAGSGRGHCGDSPARRSWYQTKSEWALCRTTGLAASFATGRAGRTGRSPRACDAVIFVAAGLPAPVEAGCDPKRAIGLKPRIFLQKPLATQGGRLD